MLDSGTLQNRDDCVRAAAQLGLPLEQVMRQRYSHTASVRRQERRMGLLPAPEKRIQRSEVPKRARTLAAQTRLRVVKNVVMGRAHVQVCVCRGGVGWGWGMRGDAWCLLLVCGGVYDGWRYDTYA